MSSICQKQQEQGQNASDAEIIEAMFAGCGYDSVELEESIDAERDVLGLTRRSGRHQEGARMTMAAAHQGLVDAIAVLPKDQRAAYDEAVLKAPRIVEMETPSDRYLAYCKYDLWACAEKLAAYWQRRKELFGSRYTLPLDLSGDGALTKDIVDLFKRGVAMTADADEFGRPVLLFERDNFEPEWTDPGDDKLKILFYILHVLAEAKGGVPNGFVAIIAIESGQHAKSSPNGKVLKLVKSEIIPVRIRSMHMIKCGNGQLAGAIANVLLSFMRKWSFLHFRVRLHSFHSNDGMLADFREYGLSSIHLPERLGGTCDPRLWFEKRRSIETKRYAFVHNHATPADDVITTQEVIATAEQARLDTQNKLKRRIDDLKQLSEDYCNDRQIAQLEAEVAQLSKKNGKLKLDNGYLQVLQRLGTFVVNDYDKDRLYIRSIVIMALSEMVRETFDIMPCYRESPTLLPSLAEWFLTHRLRFAGRHTATNEWIFSREDTNDCPAPDNLVRVRPGDELPGLSHFLERLRLGLQGKLPCQQLQIDEMQHKCCNDAREDESSPQVEQEKQRRQERAKRVKLLKRL